MTPETKVKMEKWCELAVRNEDCFVKFFIYYMCLDALMSDESHSEFGRKKKAWLVNESAIATTWNASDIVKSSIFKLAKIGVVRDERPGHSQEVGLLNSSSLYEVVEFVYQIRCNLFHGDKRSDNTNDNSLVEDSWPILQDWVRQIVNS